ncbi:hypothetical protein ACQ4M3_09550 [Leptolyngbya sp. AN03gr2]|uniref:hypothetical protein n=1 Tax=Leptolyngbya sp. AN03gr2 TaxID=3423364 RepID=UPI003D318B83
MSDYEFPTFQQYKSAAPTTEQPTPQTTQTTQTPKPKRPFFNRKKAETPDGPSEIITAETVDVDLYAQQIHRTPIESDEPSRDKTQSRQIICYALQSVGTGSTAMVVRQIMIPSVVSAKPALRPLSPTDNGFTLFLSLFLLGIGLRARLKNETNHRVLQFIGAALLGWR